MHKVPGPHVRYRLGNRASPKFNFINFLIIMLFISSSFDIFANVTIFGLNLRLFNLLQIIIIIIALMILVDRKNYVLINILIIFCIFLLSFSSIDFISSILYPQGDLRSTLYSAWLILNSIFVISGILVGSRIASIQKLIDLYLKAFVTVSLIGFLQLVLGVFGISFMTTQWWIAGRLPRVNGFTYEPSYYATYMLTGFGLAAELWRLGPLRFQRLARLTAIGTGIMIVLSSSRMGIMFVCLYLIYAAIADFVKRPTLTARRYLFGALIFFPLVVAVGYSGLSDGNFDMFLGGLGIKGTPSHSVDDRNIGMIGAYQVWLENPIIGVGLGNVGRSTYYSLIKNSMLTPGSQSDEDIAKVTGANITIETLAGTGVAGFCTFFAFLIFSFVLLKRSLMYRGVAPQLYWSLLLSFLLLVGILQLNGNVLRAYLWAHLFLIAAIIGFCYGSCAETVSKLAYRLNARQLSAARSRSLLK